NDRKWNILAFRGQMGEMELMEEEIGELLERREKAKLGGGKEKLAHQNQLGHYTARERIDKLVELGTFLELRLLAHSDQAGSEEKSAGDVIIRGVEKIDGRPVVVQSADTGGVAGREGML